MRKFDTLEEFYDYYEGKEKPEVIITYHCGKEYDYKHSVIWVKDNERFYIVRGVFGNFFIRSLFTSFGWDIKSAHFYDTMGEFLADYPEYAFN